MYEARRLPVTFQTFQSTLFRQATEAVVAPRGQARTEWDIVADLMARMSRRPPVLAALVGCAVWSNEPARQWRPRLIADVMIRTSQGGDLFGLRRGGLNFRRLVGEHPHGVVVDAPHATGVLGDVMVYPTWPDETGVQRHRCRDRGDQPRETPDEFPMRLIGMRQPGRRTLDAQLARC